MSTLVHGLHGGLRRRLCCARSNCSSRTCTASGRDRPEKASARRARPAPGTNESIRSGPCSTSAFTASGIAAHSRRACSGTRVAPARLGSMSPGQQLQDLAKGQLRVADAGGGIAGTAGDQQLRWPCSARRVNSPSRAVLPLPASPVINTTRPAPPRAAAREFSSRASWLSRATISWAGETSRIGAERQGSPRMPHHLALLSSLSPCLPITLSTDMPCPQRLIERNGSRPTARCPAHP